MADEGLGPNEVRPFTPAEKAQILAASVAEPFLMVMLARWLLHLSVAWYLLVIPCAVLGVLMVTHRPALVRLSRRFEASLQRDMERLDKWPGFF